MVNRGGLLSGGSFQGPECLRAERFRGQLPSGALVHRVEAPSGASFRAGRVGFGRLSSQRVALPSGGMALGSGSSSGGPGQGSEVFGSSIHGSEAFGPKVREGVRVCPSGHDARTASEHLAPSSIAGPEIGCGPLHHTLKRKTGPGDLSISKPRPQRQLMHHRVCAPVRLYLPFVARNVNCISGPRNTPPPNIVSNSRY